MLTTENSQLHLVINLLSQMTKVLVYKSLLLKKYGRKVNYL